MSLGALKKLFAYETTSSRELKLQDSKQAASAAEAILTKKGTATQVNDKVRILCPSNHLLVLKKLDEDASADDKKKVTTNLKAAIQQAQNSGVTCDCCGLGIGSTTYRCAEQSNEACNFDTCESCYATRSECWAILIDVTEGNFKGQQFTGLLLITKASIKGVGNEKCPGTIKGLKLSMFDADTVYKIPASNSLFVNYIDGVIGSLEFFCSTSTKPADALELGFNTVPQTKQKMTPPDDLKPLWFWFEEKNKDAEGNVQYGWGRYHFERVSYMTHPLKDDDSANNTSAQDSVLGELIRQRHYETALAMRERTRIKPLTERITGIRAKLKSNVTLGNFKAHSLFENTKFDANQFLYKPTTAKLAGKIAFDDIIYCVRLSQLSYFGAEPYSFNDFYPLEREELLLNSLWRNQETRRGLEDAARIAVAGETETDKKLRETAYEMFLVSHIALFFDKTAPVESNQFGTSLPIVQPLDDMNLVLFKPKDGPLKGAPTHIASFGAFAWGEKVMILAHSKELFTKGGDICIAYQGTKSLADVITDFHGTMVRFDPFKDGKYPEGADVHGGFYETFMHFKPQLAAALQELIDQVPTDKNIRIVIAGHSLGGALAALTMSWLLMWFDEEPADNCKERVFRYKGEPGRLGCPTRCRVICVTFGQPKVSNKALVHWLAHHPLMRTSDMRATEDVESKSPDHLTLKKGDVVRILTSPTEDEEWTGMCNGKTGKFPKSAVEALKTNDSRPWFKYLRIFAYNDPVPKLPPTAMGFVHLHKGGAIIDSEGEMYFIPREIAEPIEATTKAIREIEKKWTEIAQYHSLLVYLHRTMHFSQIMTQGAPDGMLSAFGDNDFQAKTQDDSFLNGF